MFGILLNVLPFLGKLGKGKATLSGLGAIAAGVAAKFVATHIVTDQNIVPILQAVAEIVTAVGGVVAAFGFGRKAAVAAHDAVGTV